MAEHRADTVLLAVEASRQLQGRCAADCSQAQTTTRAAVQALMPAAAVRLSAEPGRVSGFEKRHLEAEALIERNGQGSAAQHNAAAARHPRQ